jgi:hypothetical protein
VSRHLRDLAAALTGAVAALAGVAWLGGLGAPHPALPAVPADDPGELMAWAVQDQGGVELLAGGAAGGPRLYLMELRQGFEAGLPPRVHAIADDPARCASGRVLVTGETIMNFLYVRSLREASERR